MSRYAFGVICALLFALSLAAMAPARLLLPLLPQDQLVMYGPSGTLWQGQASRVLLSTPAGYLHLGHVSWKLKPLSLLLLAPRVSLSSIWGSQVISGDVTLRGEQDIDLAQVEARFGAELARQFAPVDLGGSLQVQLVSLSLRDGWPVQGSGRLVWQDGSWVSNRGPQQMGSYALDFEQPLGEALSGNIVTIEGNVTATGSVELFDGAYALDINLNGPGLDDQQLRQSLQLIATPRDNGYQVRLTGELQ